MRVLKLFIGLALFSLSVGAGSASAGLSYSGTLTSADGGLVGTGTWVNTVGSPTTIGWTITQNADSTWTYTYNLVPGAPGGISHIILEVSANFTSADITPGQTPTTYGPGQGNSNPGMPTSVFGIEFPNSPITFTSDRAPVWGDFYSKDGDAGNPGTVDAIWNAGFTNPLSDPPPLIPPSNGSFENFILVPDSSSVPVPEPATLSLLGLGLTALLTRRRRPHRSW